MRKLFFLFLALVATTSLWAHNFEVDGIYYNYLEDNNVKVTYRGIFYDDYDNEYSGEVIIPSTVTYNGTTYNVTTIGYEAFMDCFSLTSVTIPNSVTSIGDNAFRKCSSLISVTIPNSVTSIREWAFKECSSLTSITIPNSVTSIGGYAFEGTALYENPANWENGALYIDDCLIKVYEGFAGHFRIKENTRVIAGEAFNCSSLTSVTIPNSVTSIGWDAFRGCSSLTSVTIPNSVTSIEGYAFSHCTSLTSVTIPNSVTSIGNGAFSDCSSLTSMVVASGNSTYDSRDNCNAIIETATNTLIAGCQNTIIPNSVTSIGSSAFSGCSSLTSITIPNSVTSIESWAFAYCSNLTSVTIPNSVTSIGSHAFYSCTSLTSVTIPNSVTSIGEAAFSDCTSLKSVTIPNSVTSIGDDAFYGCSSLTSVTIPNSVTSIGKQAFYGCSSQTSVTIPNSVTSIGYAAFEGCTSLDTLTCLAMTPPALGSRVFYRCDNPTLFVPCAALPDYQAHEQWGRQFAPIECISSEETDTEDVIIESGTTTVIITWPTEEGADTYTIVIKKDGEFVCTLTFNSEGQLINIAFAPGRDGNHPAQYAEQAGKGYRFTVTGLEEGTHYTYNIDVKNTANQTIKSHSGEFTTQSTTAVDNITTNNANIQKIMRNGQFIIVRDGVEYNAVGQEVGK